MKKQTALILVLLMIVTTVVSACAEEPEYFVPKNTNNFSMTADEWLSDDFNRCLLTIGLMADASVAGIDMSGFSVYASCVGYSIEAGAVGVGIAGTENNLFLIYHPEKGVSMYTYFDNLPSMEVLKQSMEHANYTRVQINDAEKINEVLTLLASYTD